MAMRTIGVAFVCAVMLLTIGLTGASLSTVGGVQAQETISPETCSVCHRAQVTSIRRPMTPCTRTA